MPPRRSERVAVRNNPVGVRHNPIGVRPQLLNSPVGVCPQLLRGRRGYRTFKNGLLNVKPIGSEVEIGTKNAQDSPLLRLPSEILNMICEFALGGSPVKPSSPLYIRTRPKTATETHRFDLLRVCRQIYAETAMLPFTLNAFALPSIYDLESWADSGRLKHVQIIDICTGTYTIQDICDLKRYLPLKKLPALREVVASLVLATVANKDAERVRVERLFRTYLHDKKVEFGCVDNFDEWLARWEALDNERVQ